MFIPNYSISIGSLQFDFINKLTIRSTWETLTDTCDIFLPKRISLALKDKKIREQIKSGDAVSVKMGYNSTFIEEFSGYVIFSPDPTMPIKVSCEDEMWKLKQVNINKTFVNTSLEEIVKAIAPGYEVDVMPQSVDKLVVRNSTAAQVLLKIHSLYGFRSFFRGKTLVVGKVYTSKDVLELDPVKYEVGKNIISHTLKYRLAQDVKLQIEAININAKNKRTSVIVGDTDVDADIKVNVVAAQA